VSLPAALGPKNQMIRGDITLGSGANYVSVP
jgi:hypothetical protein